MSQFEIVNRKSLQEKRKKAIKNFGDHDFLFKIAAESLMESLDFAAKDFEFALEIGAKNGFSGQKHPKIQKLFATEFSHEMNLSNSDNHLKVTMDEELICFANKSFDLIFSVLNLHLVNDLPGCLKQIWLILKEKGFFTCSIFGPKTLFELKESILAAEIAQNLPNSAHIMPFVTMQDFASLASRAGFKEPVVTSNSITVEYDSLNKLFSDLKGMGESNSLKKMANFPMRKNLVSEIEKHFIKKHKKINVSFEILTLSCFKS